MKIRVFSGDLREATSNAIRTASKRTTIQVLNYFKLEAKETTLKITAANTDLFVMQKVNAEVETEGSCLVPAPLFNESVNKLGGFLNIEKRGKKLFLTTDDGKSNLSILTLGSEEFPSPASQKKSVQLVLEKDSLMSSIGKTQFAASNDSTRGVISGINFEVKDNKLTATALDGFRMSTVKEETEGTTGESSFIIPATTLSDISRILARSKDEKVSLNVSESNVTMEMTDAKIILSQIAGEYIAYENLFPRDSLTEAVADRKELYESIDRATLLSYSDSVNRHNTIKLEISPGKIKVMSNSEIGELNESVTADVKGPGLLIGFNARYLVDGLKKIESEKVKLQFQAGNNPLILTPEDEPEFRQLILPVRL